MVYFFKFAGSLGVRGKPCFYETETGRSDLNNDPDVSISRLAHD